ncbi:MAG: VOC family protein [Pirellulales bacterium]|nr:VOC family protein [Pirellulales bacterium]
MRAKGIHTGAGISCGPKVQAFSQRFGWCEDPFGVSWQLNLPETSSAVSQSAR